jgi:cyclopropane-fatty-acyl-phospholipid synthase
LGEAYTLGVWTCDSLAAFLMILIANIEVLAGKLPTTRTHTASVEHDGRVVRHHYDVGNDFYAAFLTDTLMAYSCGLWRCESDTLATAQMNKVETIVRKLDVRPGERVLDIGCGWGRIAAHVGDVTRARVVGTTISREQVKFINEIGGHVNTVTTWT